MFSPETRLSVRLQGQLADHVNRQIESALYSSHSEYIRDLVRRDMAMAHRGGHDDAGLQASVSRGLADIQHGRYGQWSAERSLSESIEHAESRKL